MLGSCISEHIIYGQKLLSIEHDLLADEGTDTTSTTTKLDATLTSDKKIGCMIFAEEVKSTKLFGIMALSTNVCFTHWWTLY